MAAKFGRGHTGAICPAGIVQSSFRKLRPVTLVTAQLQYTLIASSAGFQKPRQLIPRRPQRPNPRSLTRVRDLSH
jgi:hypothetical protein